MIAECDEPQCVHHCQFPAPEKVEYSTSRHYDLSYTKQGYQQFQRISKQLTAALTVAFTSCPKYEVTVEKVVEK